MNCDESRELILDVVYGEELQSRVCFDFFKHLDGCPDCSSEYREFMTTREMLQGWELEESEPKAVEPPPPVEPPKEPKAVEPHTKEAKVEQPLPQDEAGLVKEGQDALRRKDYARAAAAYQRAIELNPAKAPHWSGLGAALLEQRKSAEAAEAFEWVGAVGGVRASAERTRP